MNIKKQLVFFLELCTESDLRRKTESSERISLGAATAIRRPAAKVKTSLLERSAASTPHGIAQRPN